MWHVAVTGKIHRGFWRGNVRDSPSLKDLEIDGKMLDYISKKLDVCLNWVNVV